LGCNRREIMEYEKHDWYYPHVGALKGTGDITISSWADVVSGLSISVYKTQGFDPGDPVYKVKTWDKAGNVTEQRSSVPWSFSEKTDWVKIVNDIMPSEYSYGDLKGYMEWKKFLGYILK